jgi:apolipoprotein D and lipocalin family protein
VVPALNLNQFTVAWYEQARLPEKQEKACQSDNVILYALDDKKNTFEFVVSCRLKGDNWNSWNFAGKLDPAGSGKLRIKRIWPLTSPYLVLAIAPDGSWMVTGTPNHKSLWLLSKTPTIEAEVLSTMEARAQALGYSTSGLIHVKQRGEAMQQAVVASANARP